MQTVVLMMLAAICVLVSSSVALGQARFTDIPRDQLTEAQKEVNDAIASGPRGGVRGPFGPLLRSPELTDRVQKLGEYLRFNSSLSPR